MHASTAASTPIRYSSGISNTAPSNHGRGRCSNVSPPANAAAKQPSSSVLRVGSVAAETVTGATISTMNGLSMPPVR